ncbi:MAG: ABC transporter permease subunit [Bacillota bacterium]|nr:ABC transporter permease subunit [Bacillota bacterium]
MNKTLFLTNLKAHKMLFVIMNLVLLMYSSIMIYMFDPETSNAIAEMMEMLPKGFAVAFGFDDIAITLTSHIGSYLYGFIFIVFPMIFTVIAANSMVAKHVDRGSMAYLLATPNSRKTIIWTQAISLITMLTGLFVIQTILGILMSEMMFSGLLEVGPYIKINLITLLVFGVVSGIGFLGSCIFNESSRSLSMGISFPVAFLLLKMLSGASSDLSFLKYFTPYTLIDINKIMNTGNYTLWTSVALIIASFLIYFSAVTIFDKRSLNL